MEILKKGTNIAGIQAFDNYFTGACPTLLTRVEATPKPTHKCFQLSLNQCKWQLA